MYRRIAVARFRAIIASWSSAAVASVLIVCGGIHFVEGVWMDICTSHGSVHHSFMHRRISLSRTGDMQELAVEPLLPHGLLLLVYRRG